MHLKLLARLGFAHPFYFCGNMHDRQPAALIRIKSTKDRSFGSARTSGLSIHCRCLVFHCAPNAGL